MKEEFAEMDSSTSIHKEPSNVMRYGEGEFQYLKNLCDGNEDTTPIVLEYEKEILALIDKFGKSGQSGGSAPYVANIIADTIKKLCMFEPLGPIENRDEDWSGVSWDEEAQKGIYQHKRLSSVFKKNEICTFLYAVVFQGEDKYETFTGKVEDVTSSMRIKKFPFENKTFYIDVIKEKGNTDKEDDYEYKIKDRSQLKEVYEYYDPLDI